MEKTITWIMEVTQVYPQNGALAYEIRGAPWDLAWYEAGRQPAESAIIQVGPNQFYNVTIESFRQLLDGSASPADVVGINDMFLQIPLVTGKRLCEAASVIAPENTDCWVVDGESQVQLPGVKGIEPGSTYMEYSISKVTRPDHAGIGFVPGVGITRYLYVHHGSVSECDLKLVEFNPGTK